MGHLEASEDGASSSARLRFKNEHFPQFSKIESVSWDNYSLFAAVKGK